ARRLRLAHAGPDRPLSRFRARGSGADPRPPRHRAHDPGPGRADGGRDGVPAGDRGGHALRRGRRRLGRFRRAGRGRHDRAAGREPAPRRLAPDGAGHRGRRLARSPRSRPRVPRPRPARPRPRRPDPAAPPVAPPRRSRPPSRHRGGGGSRFQAVHPRAPARSLARRHDGGGVAAGRRLQALRVGHRSRARLDRRGPAPLRRSSPRGLRPRAAHLGQRLAGRGPRRRLRSLARGLPRPPRPSRRARARGDRRRQCRPRVSRPTRPAL
ncbi:MAG: L-fuconolactone hydrolase, partial [uncultured Thermomicrobiales bacterium]